MVSDLTKRHAAEMAALVAAKTSVDAALHSLRAEHAAAATNLELTRKRVAQVRPRCVSLRLMMSVSHTVAPLHSDKNTRSFRRNPKKNRIELQFAFHARNV
jgi:anti-sigma factor RsiW